MQMFNSKFDLEVEKMKVEHGFTFCGKFASTFTFYCQGSPQNFLIAIIMIFFIFVLADVMLISSLRLKTCFLLGKGQTVYRVSWTWRAMHGTVSFKSWPKFNSTAEFVEGAFFLQRLWSFYQILEFRFKNTFECNKMNENIISRAFQWDCDDFLQVRLKTQWCYFE